MHRHKMEGASHVAQMVNLNSIPCSGRSPGEGTGNPLQYSSLENSMGRGAWQATVQGVAKALDMTKQLTRFQKSPH